MYYVIYKMSLTGDNKIEKSIKEFIDKHDAIMYCHMMNSVEADFGSVWYYFYFEIANRDFDEFIKEEDILREAKSQINGRFKLLDNEKIILNKAKKALFKTDEEAV